MQGSYSENVPKPNYSSDVHCCRAHISRTRPLDVHDVAIGNLAAKNCLGEVVVDGWVANFRARERPVEEHHDDADQTGNKR
jgi:hypothetical protein